MKSEPTFLSDHKWVTVSLGCDFLPDHTSHNRLKDREFDFSCFNFDKADFTRMEAYLENVSRNTEFVSDCDKFLAKFENTLLNVFHLTVPIKSSYLNTDDSKSKKVTSSSRISVT